MKRVLWIVMFLPTIGCESPESPHRSALPKEEPQVAMTHDFAVPVLMYHRVRELSKREARHRLQRDLTVSPSDFETQVRFLKENGFSFLTVSQVEGALHRGEPLPERAVALTFDDGYDDNFLIALPILKKYQAKATVFMVTSNFGKRERLSWANAREMLNGGVTFESHSVTHPDLTTLSEPQLRSELSDSKRHLEDSLDIEVRSLAYPTGAFNDRVVAMMPSAGYAAGWKKGGGVVEPGNATDPFRLPRVRIHGRTDMEKFKERALSGLLVMADKRAKVAQARRSAPDSQLTPSHRAAVRPTAIMPSTSPNS